MAEKWVPKVGDVVLVRANVFEASGTAVRINVPTSMGWVDVDQDRLLPNPMPLLREAADLLSQVVEAFDGEGVAHTDAAKKLVERIREQWPEEEKR